MALEIAVLRRTTPSSTGTVSLTDSAITDFKVALFFLSNSTVDGQVASHAKTLVGACDADGGQFAMAPRVTDARNTFQEGRTRLEQTTGGACLVWLNDSGTQLGAEGGSAAFSSASSDGVTIDFTASNTSGLAYTVVLLGGDIEANVHTNAVPTGGLTENTLGIDPDVLLVAHGIGTFGSTIVDARLSLGACVRKTGEPQASIGTFADFNVSPSGQTAYVHTSRVAATHDGSSLVTVDIESFITGGYTARSNSGSPEVGVVALELTGSLADYAVAVETIGGTTGLQSFTELGISPKLVVGVASLVTTEDAAVSSALAGSQSFFVFTGDAESSHSVHNEVGLDLAGPDVSNTGSVAEDQAITVLDDGGSKVIEGTLDAMLSTGFRLNLTSAQAGRMVVLALADGLPPQAVDETLALSEDPGKSDGRQVAETLEVEEESDDVLADAIFAAGERSSGDNALAGSQDGDTGSAGSADGDDGSTGTLGG